MAPLNKTNNMSPILLLFFHQLPSAFGDLQVGFYGSTCPKAESLVQKLVQKRFRRDASLTSALLRLQFHDCFVRGCDASILIDSTEGSKSEKDAEDSFFLRGFGVIDDIKEILEVECPSTVSCADIIVLAVRDVVALAGGSKYEVPTGRRDGLVSNIDDVDIPKPDFSVGFAFDFFDEFGLTLADMITLLGAHTVGRAHCEFFSNRLPRPGNESSDPTMDPTLKAKLDKLCFTTTSSEAVAFLDQGTPFTFDNSFYKQLLLR
ncbi:hypothetical protein K1719_027122 [Acacia pycnantha]|nr:hypothetical protein K1719_027122 [Acacia pycnantha]